MDAVESAKAWIESLSGGNGGLFNHWRVSLLSKRYSKDGKERPLRIRRFAEGCPASCMKEAMVHLLSLAPYKGVVFNGQPLDGEYRPTLTYWKRDSGEAVNSVSRTDATYTLIQDLIDNDESDSEGANTGASCTETTSAEWHWDDVAPGEVPSTGDMQGRTYAVTNVSRNEDGTFNWTLVTQVAKTQISDWVVVKDNLFEKVRRKVYRGLYGEPGAFVDQDGDAISVPSASAKNGVTVELSVNQSPDCTYAVEVIETTAKKNIPASESDKLTQYERNQQVQTKAVNTPLGDAPEAAGGIIKTHRSDLRPDGLYDVVEGTDTERQVLDAKITKRKTLRGVVEVKLDQNVTGYEIPSELKIGEQWEVTKTPGRLFTVEHTTSTEEPVGTIGEECSQTIYQHGHSKLTNEKEQPEPEAEAAKDGVIHEVGARATENGTWDVTRKETHELNVNDAVRERRKTLRGVIETTVDQNTHDGSIPNTLEIGEQYKVTKTPGGLFTVEHTTSTEEPVGTIGEGCAKNEQLHQHTTETNQKDAPKSEGGSWSTNKTISQKATRTDFGTWDVTRTETNYSPVETVVSDVKGPVVSEKTTQFFNRAKYAQDGVGVNQSIGASVSRNDHGTFDGKVTVTTFKPRATTVKESWAPVKSTTTVVSHNDGYPKEVEFGSITARPEDTGGYSTSKTVEEPIPIDTGWITWDSEVRQKSGVYKYHHGYRIFRNLTECPKPDRGRNVSVRVDINKFGRFDGVISYEDLYDWAEAPAGTGPGGSTDIYVRRFIYNSQTATLVEANTQKYYHGRYFYGAGNEGAYASALHNSAVLPGAPSVGGRVVWLGMVDNIGDTEGESTTTEMTDTTKKTGSTT